MATGKRVYRCYLTTPFRGEFQHLRRLIAGALKEMNIHPVLWEDFPATTQTIAEALQDQIRNADFIIADITGSNANVMFELGFASALGKPTLLLVQEEARQVPFNVAGYLYNVYNPSEPEQLRGMIRTWVPHILEHINVEDSES